MRAKAEPIYVHQLISTTLSLSLSLLISNTFFQNILMQLLTLFNIQQL